jgi:hypothetical protein
MKPCKVCNKLTRSKYGICKRLPECLSAYQKACYNAHAEAYRAGSLKFYQAHREQILPKQHANYKRRGPVYAAFNSAKNKSVRLGIPFDLTPSTMPVIPSVCPILGIKLAWTEGPRTNNTPSFDRIIPTLGYIPENVWWISWRANRLKCDATPAELMRIAIVVAQKVNAA